MKLIGIGLVAASLLGVAWAQDGQALYQQNCSGCHGPSAQGVPGAFPPLAGNPKVQDQAHVLQVIKQGLSGPLEVGGQKFNGVMPPLSQVSQTDAKAIASYLKGLSSSQGASAPQPPAAPAPQVNPALAAEGRALFLGQQRLANGGSPCMACHTAGSSLMGGGSLGKNLTDLYTRLGTAGIQGVLGNIAFPVMREAYKDKALTPQEISALTAYFAEVAKEPTRPARMDSGRLFYAGALGGLILFGVMYLFWSNRRVGLAERLRRRNS